MYLCLGLQKVILKFFQIFSMGNFRYFELEKSNLEEYTFLKNRKTFFQAYVGGPLSKYVTLDFEIFNFYSTFLSQSTTQNKVKKSHCAIIHNILKKYVENFLATIYNAEFHVFKIL